MKIDVIGKGNVGYHLTRALDPSADVANVDSRTLAGLRDDADIYIIAVSDNAIQEVAGRLSKVVSRTSLAVHTSGTMPLSALSAFEGRSGVLYPLQTFSKNSELLYDRIPVFIEANDTGDLQFISEVAHLISPTVITMDSERRKDLHVASVLSCNFVNHLWYLADMYLKEKEIDFSLLHPLIEETVKKLNRLSPYESQTGPAVRHDSKTIESHLNRIAGYPDICRIYKDLTESIEKHHPLGSES